MFFGVNAQKNDLERERMEKLSRTQETSAKFLKGTPTSATRAIECMPEATYSNVPTDFTTGVTSNTDAGYIVAQKVQGFANPVGAIRFFGIQGFYSGGWNPMNDVDPFEFEIKFYQDNSGTPGTLISTETVSLNHVNTDVAFNTTFNIFHWDYAPSSPITGLTETFWVGIANTNPNAWFMWLNTPSGQGSGSQYEIATSTWEATDNACGICIVPVLTEPGAPAAPADLVVTPDPMGALGATIAWTNPALTFAGDPLTELTSVSLWVNDEATAEYENNTPVIDGPETYAYTATTPGLHTFSVYGINTAGDGAAESQTVWLGNDVPAAPTNVVLAKDDMETQLSWEAPTAGLNGGYFTETGVTYNVLRYPGAVLVSEDQAGLTFTETLVTPGFYHYEVIASNAVGIGGSATSNDLLIGNFIIYEMFDGAELPEGWTTMGLGLTNWKAVNSNKAGGDANEIELSWFPSFTGASYFASPVINTTTYYSLTLNYKDLFDDYNTNPKTIGVKTTIDGGATWLVVHEEAMANGNVNIGPRDTEVVIDNEHVGNPNFQLAFFYDGYTFDIDGWYIDNVTLTGVLAVGADVTFTVKEGTEPIEDAIVEVNSMKYTTDASGTVTAFVLEGTDIPYTVNKFAYAETAGTITVVDGIAQDVNVELVPVPTYSVTFNVMNANSNPVNALVELQEDGVTVASGTAAGGTITFAGIPNGDYTYTVTMQGYSPASGNVTVTDADVTVPDVELAIDPNIIIGTGNVTGKPYPVNAFYGYSYTQSIYLKSEIANMPMTITHVKYYFNGASLTNSNDWTIYLGHTDKSEFASKTDWIPLAELTQVYSAEFTSPTGAGWIEFEIEDFEYNGIDNLVIAVDENKPAYNSSSDRFLCTAVTGNRSIAAYADSNNPDPSNPPSANVSEAFIPNTILTAYPKPGANVTFTVIDGADPIEGAVVVVETKAYTTLADGTATAYVGEGTDIPYTVNKFGFAEYEGTITVVNEIDQDVDVTLVALPAYSVTLNIKNTLNDPLDATVTLYFGDTEIETGTAVAGEIVFADIPVGSYTFDAAFEGYVAQTDLPLEVVDAPVSETITLLEVMTEPYGLLIDIVGYDATFSWNNSFGFSDDFESYDDFALEFSPWTLIDVDGLATFGFSGMTFPNSGSPMAGIIFNPTATTPVMTSSLAHSGDKYVAVFNPESSAPCNDWIIAPKTIIMPNGQVSFWARGGNALYSAEKFQVAVSTTDATPASFTAISPVVTCPANSDTWVQYTYSLSDYAGQEVYVGIHVTSADQFYFCLDDFSISAAKARALVGYNVYLNDLEVPVNAEPITETNYLFEGLTVGMHTAGVEAVYTTGATEIVTVDFEVKTVYTVTLTVVDDVAAPIQGATVTIGENEQTTDATGVVTFSLIDGTYSYTVAKEGYVNVVGEIVVDGANVDETITLNSAYTVTLTVVDGTTPIDGATVIFNAGEGLTTDASGKVVISDVINGTYNYAVTKAGYVEATGEIAVDGANVEETISLTDDIVAPIDLQVVVDGTTATFTYDAPTGSVLTESFEESVPPAGWTLDNTNATTWAHAGTITFDTGDIVPIDGAYQAYLQWQYSSQDEWLITPSFTVPTGANLTFWSYTGAFGSP
ncbi:MAG TPA: hypothetical protein DG754_12845, partial [Bacteroidales bacterium]|nr:hypothetical protein [Bacteroidales bacterium]